MLTFPTSWASLRLEGRSKLIKAGLTLRLSDRVRTFLTRGNSVFFSLGAIYVLSEKRGKDFQRDLRRVLPSAPPGQAFVRWGLRNGQKGERAVLITGVGRLGNSILQTLNTTMLAKVFDTTEAFYHRFDAVNNQPLTLSGGITLSKLPFFTPDNGFRPRLIWRTYALNSDAPLRPPRDDEFSTTRDSLANALVPTFKCAGETPLNSLTIYLRSGDVFSEKPEPHYAQPPWAFYEKVLQFKAWSRVKLVTEDKGNPTYEPILEWCRERDTPVDVLGATLNEAVEAVMSSSHLVSARGTFVPSLLFLTDDDKEVFQFQDEKNPLMGGGNLTLWRVTDKDGIYVASVMSRNWANTEAQRALMLDYPADSLSEIVRMP